MKLKESIEIFAMSFLAVGFVGGCMYLLATSRHHRYLQCEPEERGEVRNTTIVAVCDGEHWVPVRIPVPKGDIR